jgi:putative redox protein
MVNIAATYGGGLHCTVVHAPSGSRIETDAPVDNNGKGEKFSPTDLMGAALASCILTVMGIVAGRDHIALEGARVDVEKEMTTGAERRISALKARVTMPAGIPLDSRAKLERTALHCPVHKSLLAEIAAPISFVYPD